jgi:hypothetical protein
VNYNPLTQDLVEIFEGKTTFDFYGQRLFFRHSSIRDQSAIGLFFEKYKNIAIKKGIETEEQVYKRLRDEKDWTDDDDLKIVQLEEYVSNLKKTKDKLFLPSQKEAHQKLINEEESKLNFLLNKKSDLIGMTAENYANKMSNEEFLRTLIYSDESLKNLKFSHDDFGSLTNTELSEITKIYLTVSKKFSDLNIQTIVLQDFFNMYLSWCDNSYNFFGKFLHELTAFQMKLLIYGKIFYNIFQYHDDIPDHLKKDPKAIFDFVDSKKSREKFQSSAKEDSTTMLFGATQKDVEILDPSAKKISLSDQITKGGGVLTMDQMIELMNQK